MKLYYFYTLKALWDGQDKTKMYYGMSKVKKQLSGKRSIFDWIANNLINYLHLMKESILSTEADTHRCSIAVLENQKQP